LTKNEFIVALFNGVSFGFLLFLVAAGLSLVFGVLGVLNFAHGGFFMIGAFVAYQIGGAAPLSPWAFIWVVIASGLVMAVIASVIEIGLFRRMYKRAPFDFLLMTFALTLVAEGAVREIWGVNPLTMTFPRGWGRGFVIFGATVPQYSVFVIIVGVVILGALTLVLLKTRLGKVIRTVAEDRWMAEALGINVRLVFTGVFALGIFLAGVAGAMVGPSQALTPQLGVVFLVQAFAVVIVGGLDSVPGALVASLLLGLLNSFLVVTFYRFAPYSLYLGIIVVLLVRPQGLMGSRELLRRVS
jgi:branched-chain amino acid transport system permease protein